MDAFNLYLADDDCDDRQFFADALADLPFPAKLQMFSSGEKLLSHFDSGDFNYPDAIFLDVSMPRMSGIQCLTEIRSRKCGLQSVPVFMLTTSSDPRAVEDCAQKGASSYLVKPTSYKALVSMLREVLTMSLRLKSEPRNYSGNIFLPPSFNS